MKTSSPALPIQVFFSLCLLSAQPGHAATITWSGAGADTNWSTILNWTGGQPAATNDIRFFDPGVTNNLGVPVTNVVDATQTIRSLQYGNSNGLPHTTLINPALTLTVTNGFTVGTEVDSGTTLVVSNYILGPGATLVVSNSNLTVRQGSASSGSQRAICDMSGLDTLVANVSAVQVAVAGINRSSGILILAKTNIITASGATPAVNIGLSGGNNGNLSELFLGQTNAIFANGIAVGRQKQQKSSILFNPAFVNSVAYFRAGDGVSRVPTWRVGDGESNSGTTTCQGTNDFSGGTVDAMVDTMIIGRASTGGTALNNTSIGTLTFSAGTINVNTLQVGLQTTAEDSGNGTVNVNGTANLVINTSLQLGLATGGTGAGSTKGALNINGGIVQAFSISTSTNTGGSPITLANGGTLSVNTTAGSPAVPMTDFTIADSTLSFEIVNPQATNLVVNNFTTGGITNLLTVTFLPGITIYPAKFRLIQYLSGNISTGIGLTNLNAAYTGYLTNDTSIGSFDLVLTAGPIAKSDTWTGATSGNWDASTMNWLSGGIPSTYSSGDFVLFDDTAGGSTTVNLTGNVIPSTLTVSNNAKTYAFKGIGGIAGPTGLIKQGTGTLVVSNTGINTFLGNIGLNGGALSFARSDVVTLPNVISGTGTLIQSGSGTLAMNGANTSFTGAVLVTQGILQTGNASALGTTNGATTINAGGALDVNGQNLGAEPITASGSGATTNGAIINTGADQQNALRYVTLGANTTFGGSGRWDIRAPTTSDPSGASLSTTGHGFKLTKTGSNTVALVGTTIDPALGDVDIQQGTLSVESATTSLGSPSSNLTVRAGATFQLFNLTNQLNKVITLSGDGVTTTVNNGAGANVILGPVTLSASTTNIFNAGGTSLSLNGGIGGSGKLTKTGSGYLILAGTNTYSGATTVNGGTLALNGMINGGGLLTNAIGTTLVGNGTNTGVVNVSGTLNPGDVNLTGTFGSGALTLGSTATLTFDVGSVNTIGSGVNDLIQVTGNFTDNSTNTIGINLIQGSLQQATYRLINYTGTLSGLPNTNVSLVAGGVSRYALSIKTNTANQVNLVVGGSAANLKWNSTSSTVWDVTNNANWFNLGSSANDVFYQADSVLFDDSVPGVQTGITLGAAVAPSAMTNNSTVNSFSISGTGKLTGAATIVKQGASTLLLGTTNDFLGPVLVQSGILQVTNNSALGATNGGTVISSGATLDVLGTAANSLNLGLEPITVSGSGVGGNGAIINSGNTSQQNATRLVTLTGDTWFGGPGQWVPGNGTTAGRWDIRGTGAALSTGGHAYNLFKIGANQIALVSTTIDTNLANIDIQGGALGFENGSSSMGNPASTLTVEAGATLEFFQSGANTNSYNKQFVLNGDGVSTNIYNWSGVSSINGRMTLNGACILGIAGTALTNNCVTSGTGSLAKVGAGTLVLTATNTYTGYTAISNGTLSLLGSASISNSSKIIVLATNGTLDLSGRTDGTLTMLSGQTLAGGGTVLGNVTAGPGTIIVPGDVLNTTLAITTNLVLNNSSNVFGLVTGFGTGSGDDMIAVSNNLTLSGVTHFLIAPAGPVNVGETHTVIQYGGSLVGGAANLQVSASPGFTFSLVDPSTTPGSIQVHVDQVPLNLVWRGGTPGSETLWNTTSPNWIIQNTSTATNFAPIEGAFFDDSANTNWVALVGALDPLGMEFDNSSTNFTLSGSGKITGTGGLVVNGFASVVIANSGSNDFTGDVTINNGILQVGAGGTAGNLGVESGLNLNNGTLVFDRSDSVNVPNIMAGPGVLTNLGTGVLTLSGNNTIAGGITVAQGTLRVNHNHALGGTHTGGTTILPGATLDVGGPSLAANSLFLSNGIFTVSGTGVGANGAIVNSSTNGQQNALRFVTLSADTTFGGAARWDIRSGAANTDIASLSSAALLTGGQAYNLTKAGSNQVSIVGVYVDAALANIFVKEGILSIEHSSSMGDANQSLVVSNGATLQFWQNWPSNLLNKVIALYGDGVGTNLNNGSGNNVFFGPITLNTNCVFNLASGTTLTISNNISEGIAGTTLSKTGSGRLTLAGTDSYTGNTVITDGRLSLTGVPAIPASPIFDIAGAGAILDLNSAGGTLTLSTGQTVRGDGTIWGTLIVGAGATVSPGESIGALTVTNAVTLQGNAVMEVDKAAGTNDVIRGASSISYSGTLTVNNLSNTTQPLANGDTLKLFSATTYSGAFTSFVPPAPGSGFFWDTNRLTVDGTLSVRSSITNHPSISSFVLSGNNLVTSGTNGIVNGQYYVLASTNAALAFTNWTRLVTNYFDASGNFRFTNTITPTIPNRFFMLQVP